MTKVAQYYLIEDGPLAGTKIEPLLAFIAVEYPHRKTKDLYNPPFEDEEKALTHPWHCNQENCPEPDFHGGMERFIEHLKLHAGRSLKKAN